VAALSEVGVLPVVRDVKDRIDTAMKATGWCAIAGAAALVMLGFFCAALFLWMAERNGPIVACLVLGGIFLLIMIIAAIAFASPAPSAACPARACQCRRPVVARPGGHRHRSANRPDAGDWTDPAIGSARRLRHGPRAEPTGRAEW
jgi:hypothetical protein